jgi:protein involved in temperature-dependent protein secretion
MHEGDSDRVMTYDAFTLRISGRIEDGLARYEQAISANPANILARSYYGQALVLQGEYGMAREQLAAIDNRESWAWRALNHAIETGETANY